MSFGYQLNPFLNYLMKTALYALNRFYVVILALIVVGNTALAQEIPASSVPQVVRTAFEKSHSGETNWTIGPKGLYEAHLNKSGHELVYVYTKSGYLTIKKKVINQILIPNSINTDLASSYSDYRMGKSYQVMTRSKEKYYEIHASNSTTTKRMRYSLAGAYISSVDINQSEADQTLVASSDPVVTTPVTTPIVSSGGMRGDSDFADDELIDDDIADLFEEEDDSDLFQALDADDNWDDIILEEEEDDDFEDLEDWDIPSGDGF